VDATRRVVLRRIVQVQDLEDRVHDADDAHRQHQRPPEEPAPPAELQPLGVHHSKVHAPSSRREVISRNRSSSDTRSASMPYTGTDASTSRRFISATALSTSTPGSVPSVTTTESPSSVNFCTSCTSGMTVEAV